MAEFSPQPVACSRCAAKAPRVALLALGLAACAALCSATVARAEPRFGDSSWVAPMAPAPDDSALDGSRVAPPDGARGWETALRTPFRVVFLPLRLVARGMEAGIGRYGDRLFAPVLEPPSEGFKIGLRVDPGKALEGDLYDIGIGPAMSWNGMPTENSKTSLSGSWSTNDARRARFSSVIGEPRPVSVRLAGNYDYRPNQRFYGIGNDSKEEDRSIYLLENSNVEGALLIGPAPWHQLRLVAGYSAMSPRHGYHDSPNIDENFDPSEVPFYRETTEEILLGVTGDLASLNDARNPASGVHAHAELRRAVGLEEGDPDYHEWLVEGRVYVPVFALRRVIAFRAAYAGVDPTGDDTTELPYYRLAMNDGPLRFASYDSQRFRDRQLMLGRIEYRWAIWRRLNAVALYDVGEVAPSLKAFTWQGVHPSYGGSLRIGVEDEKALRLDLTTGDEGFKAVLKLGSVF